MLAGEEQGGHRQAVQLADEGAVGGGEQPVGAGVTDRVDSLEPSPHLPCLLREASPSFGSPNQRASVPSKVAPIPPSRAWRRAPQSPPAARARS